MTDRLTEGQMAEEVQYARGQLVRQHANCSCKTCRPYRALLQAAADGEAAQKRFEAAAENAALAGCDVSELRDERDTLRAEVERLRGQLEDAAAGQQDLLQENDRLARKLAESERAREEARGVADALESTLESYRIVHGRDVEALASAQARVKAMTEVLEQAARHPCLAHECFRRSGESLSCVVCGMDMPALDNDSEA